MPEDAYFPVDVASIAAWCASSKVPEDEGRARFLQVSALRSVLDDERLADYVVFKGAGALRLFYGLPRRSGDLDFVVRRDEAAQAKLHDREQVSRLILDAVKAGLPGHARGIPRAQDAAKRSLHIDVMVKPDSFDPIRTELLGDPPVPVWVATIEELLAEKARAMLRQSLDRPVGDRSKDAFDVHWIDRYLSVDWVRSGEILLRKCAAMKFDALGVYRSSAAMERVRERVGRAYDTTLPPTLWQRDEPPFDEAWDATQAVLDRMLGGVAGPPVLAT